MALEVEEAGWPAGRWCPSPRVGKAAVPQGVAEVLLRWMRHGRLARVSCPSSGVVAGFVPLPVNY